VNNIWSLEAVNHANADYDRVCCLIIQAVLDITGPNTDSTKGADLMEGGIRSTFLQKGYEIPQRHGTIRNRLPHRWRLAIGMVVCQRGRF